VVGRGTRVKRVGMHRRAMARAGAAVFTSAILLVTLSPAEGSATIDAGVLCLTCSVAPIANLLRNIVLFLPLGFVLFYLLPGVGAVTLAGAALSAAVETLQLFIPGRNPLLVDLLANAGGAALGAALAASLPLWIRPRGRAATGLLAVVTLLATAAATAGPLLLVPAPPRDGLWVQWNPRLSPGGAYGGRLVDVRIGASPLPAGPTAAGAELTDRFLAGEPLTLVFRRARAEADTRALFRVLSVIDGWPLVTFGIRDDAVTAHLSYRAGAIGLAHPRVVASGILEGAEPGAIVRLVATFRADGGLRVDGPAGRHDGPAADPSLGWSLLYFPERTGPLGIAVLGFLWCGVLVLAPAFLARRRGVAAAVGVIVLAPMVLLPLLTPFMAPLALHGWAGASTGWAAGRMARAAVDEAPARLVPRAVVT
jgi:hypothetical protein